MSTAEQPTVRYDRDASTWTDEWSGETITPWVDTATGLYLTAGQTSHRFDVIELMICDHCAVVTANGCEDDADRDCADAIELHLGDDAAHLVLGDTDAHVPFSFEDCESCGDPLAGGRYPAVILRPRG